MGTFIRAYLASSCLILSVLLPAVGHAQESAHTNPSRSSGTATAAQTKDVPTANDRVVLKVGNINVTEEEFESRIEGIEPHGGDPDKEGATEKDRRRLGDDYASVLMLSQQALANGLDSSPEVMQKLAVARLQILSDAEFASLMRQAAPSSEEIRAYYSAHLSDYDEVQIRRLFIWKARDKSKDGPVLGSQAAKDRADQVRRQWAAGTSEKTLAENLIKSGEGMLDPEPLVFLRGQLSPAIEKVAFALKQGEWSEVEDTPSRLLVIQLVKRDRQALGQVSSHIEKDLQGQKMQALLDGLKAKAGIWMDEQFFGTAVPDSQSEPQKSAK